MTHSLSWYVENHILRCAYAGDVTPEDVKEAAAGIIGFADQIPNQNPKLHVWFALDPNAKITNPIKEYISDPLFQTYSEHPALSLGWSLYSGVENNPLWQLVTSAINHNAGLRMRWFTNPQDLVDFIYEQDHDLTDIPRPEIS